MPDTDTTTGIEASTQDRSEDADAVVVYGEGGGGILFLPKQWAEGELAYRKALQWSSTWGELKEALADPDEYESLWETWRDSQDEDLPDEPTSELYFNAEQLPSYGELAYFAWPAQYMLEWLPDDIREKFGDVGSSMVSGDALFLDPKDKDAIIKALEKHGYRCVENQELIDALTS